MIFRRKIGGSGFSYTPNGQGNVGNSTPTTRGHRKSGFFNTCKENSEKVAKNAEKIGDSAAIAYLPPQGNVGISMVTARGQNSPMGTQSGDATPPPVVGLVAQPQGALPPAQPASLQAASPLAQSTTQQMTGNPFFDFESLRLLRENDRPVLSIGFDTEWVESGSTRLPLSYQFALKYDGEIHEFMFVMTEYIFADRKRPTLEYCLGTILSLLGFQSFRRDNYTERIFCEGFKPQNGAPVWRVLEKGEKPWAYSFKLYPLFPGNPLKGERYLVPAKKTVDTLHMQGKINRYAKKDDREWRWYTFRLTFPKSAYVPVQLICHTGKVDLSLFRLSHKKHFIDNYDGRQNILRFVNEIQGGTMSLQPSRRLGLDVAKTGEHSYVIPISLTIRDTMGQAPAGKKSLDSLGEIIGIPKIKNSRIQKDRMDLTLAKNPRLFFKYASRDSLIALLYPAEIYGENQLMPVTLTSAGASVLKKSLMEYLGTKDDEEFNRKYRGLVRVPKGKVPAPYSSGFIEESNLEPISRVAGEVQLYATNAYHGGFNGSSRIGWFEVPTFDFDLIQAYPTAMGSVPDIDWENPIRQAIDNRDLDLSLWNMPFLGEYPLLPFFGYCRFEFPADVKFPSICVAVDGNLIYPRTSNGLDGVFTAGPEVYAALKLGAKVFCERGFFLNTLHRADGKESYSLGAAVRRMLQDRLSGKKIYGKGSFIDKLLKELVNSGYGKISQNVVKKQAWSTFCKDMESVGASAITNPVSAALVTSLVRAELVAALNEVTMAGFHGYSVTTDGFISDMPFDEMKNLPLLGFGKWMKQIRRGITDGADEEIWEQKHDQESLLNLTTRGNMALKSGGVSAHNSTRSNIPKDDPDYDRKDRLWFITKCLSRVGPISYHDSVWTQFKDMAQGTDFQVTPVTKNVRMDFDMKRKPDESTFETVFPEVEGVMYEIANFDTLPHEDVNEFAKYRSVKDSVTVLRTERDWHIFFAKIGRIPGSGSKQRIKDFDWAILFSCVMGHRMGYWEIPKLNDPNLTVAQKCDWLNDTGISPHRKFNENAWKNSRRTSRLSMMLPRKFLKVALKQMNAIIK